MASHGHLTLGDVAARTPVLNVACTRCDRQGRYQTAALVDKHGADFPVPAWLREVSAGCPRRVDPHPSIYELCGAHCPGLAGLMK